MLARQAYNRAMAAFLERFNPDLTLGRRVLIHRELSSTQDEAWRLADAGSPQGTIVRASTQTQGRGRFDRRWEASPGEALLISTVLYPTLGALALLPVVATLATLDAVTDLTGERCSIKWPNDVMWRDRKLAGVLVESSVDTEGRSTAVVGIGLNLALRIADHPSITDVAASVDEIAGRAIDDREAEHALLLRLSEHYAAAGSGEDLIAVWRRALSTLGQRVVVHRREGPVTGTAEDVDGAGRLLLRVDDGTLLALAEGDVTLAG